MSHEDETSTDDGQTGRDTYRGHWNESKAPSIAVVETVAVATNREATGLPPLYDTVDVDSLDALMRSANGGPGTVSVSFRYADVDVTVDSTGDIRLDGAATE